jgi:predicted 3-demethylubiquinone-9 3-methyltransferase (glyoxalase superfamily)
MPMSKITPCLWFDHQAEEAARLYTSLIPDSRIDAVNRSPADNPSGKKGDVLTVDFTLAGTPFTALNGGPELQFNEAISFTIDCADQAEVDRYWDALIADGGEPGECGWLKDRFGLSWQIVPRLLDEYYKSDDRAGAERAMQAMLTMQKLDVERLREAFEGVPA